FFLLARRLSRSTLFPYTTLFRSDFFAGDGDGDEVGIVEPLFETAAGESRIAEGKELFECFAADERGLVTQEAAEDGTGTIVAQPDRKSTRLNSSHVKISYAVFCL